MVPLVSRTAARVRVLNDQLRKHRTGGRVVTRGVAALGEAVVVRIDQVVKALRVFCPDNDPYGEHDFELVEVAS